jgi:ribonuclease HII
METTQIIPIKITNVFPKNFYESCAWGNKGYVVGIDEAGRGCSAGPVVAAAAMLHPRAKHKLLKDSKLLTHDELKTAYQWILKHSWYGVGVVSHAHIDTYNIYKATQCAMTRALAQLKSATPHVPTTIVVDAMPLIQKSFQAETVYFIKGESKSTSIAAASIIAKVTRDNLMEQMSASFPLYNLAQHKGYITAEHKKSVKTNGTSLIHRLTFIHESDSHEQQTLC